MNLKTFLDMLTEIELSQHIFGQTEEDKLVKGYELINLINRGLGDIHTRFVLKKGELFLNVDPCSRYSYDITDTNLVLSEQPDPNILRILEVWDECGNKVHLNTIHRYTGCATACANVIQLIDKTTLKTSNYCGTLNVIYQKGADLIKKPNSLELFRPELLNIDIDLEYIDALIFYVCARLFSVNLPMEGYAAQYSPSVTYHRKYEEECARLKDLNFEIDGTDDQSQRFHDSTFP